MAAHGAEIAAIGEAAIQEVRDDGNKHSQAAVDNGLYLPGGNVGVSEYNEKHDGSSSHEGVEFPTEDERHSLRRIPEAIPLMAYWVAFCELAERFSYYGTTQVFQNFIQRPRPDFNVGGYTGANTSAEGNPGALNRGQQTATALSTFNSFYVYLTPILGAYLADAHWGRFKTISIAVGIATIGHILLIFSSIPSVIDNPNGALACFVIALVVMGTGTGFFKSNVSTLIAEQVTNKKQVIRTTKAGERVILDPTLTTARLFMYVSITPPPPISFQRLSTDMPLSLKSFTSSSTCPCHSIVLEPLEGRRLTRNLFPFLQWRAWVIDSMVA